MRYGIPDFKLEKNILDRRIDIWVREGIRFKTRVKVGVDYSAGNLLNEFDAVCLAGGSRVPRDLKIPGRELKGIHFAMDYLTRSNRGECNEGRGKNVVVIGGGDTGADCVGTANRQGAVSVVQIELLPRPPETRPVDQPWPKYPMILKTSTNHGEGCERLWSISTKKFKSQNLKDLDELDRVVKSLECVRVDAKLKDVPGTEFEIEADLVILALGFLYPEHNGMLEELGVEFDCRGNVRTDGDYMTSVKGVFSAGDMRRGQSLVVWALYEGKEAAKAANKYLRGDKDG